MTRTGIALASRTYPLVATADPLDDLAAGGFAWFCDGFGLTASGVATRVAAADAADVLAGIESDDPLGLPGTGPLAVGALGFAGDEALVIPARVVGRDARGRAWVTETGPADASAQGWPATSAPSAAPPDRRAWDAAVTEALDRIAAGRLRKVVLAREVTVDAPQAFDPVQVVGRLRRANPSCFTYAAGAYVGASPELLVRRRDLQVMSRPMAGTVAQGGSDALDGRLVAAMAASNKEQAEHRLVVTEVRAALAGVCADVIAGRVPDVVRLPTVAHLVTTVVGRLRDRSCTAVDLAALLHPTPAVAGVPRVAALEAIAQLERFDRGLYAGPVGWVDARGDGDWAVALRGATLDGTRARLVAGAGIVAGSDPAAEWDETEAKLEAVRSALIG